jgi:hypothetical protein
MFEDTEFKKKNGVEANLNGMSSLLNLKKNVQVD